ncbi:unnamed protein product [Prorocentrum cordatum]|uniref:Uncharacterized protein n=1 Tax=Prorocentrum cordatum TaxID=2364126 RepID=A0ABN9WCG7_9DINO|nr:unnamed protein product [Polarella glacialis]
MPDGVVRDVHTLRSIAAVASLPCGVEMLSTAFLEEVGHSFRGLPGRVRLPQGDGLPDARVRPSPGSLHRPASPSQVLAQDAAPAALRGPWQLFREVGIGDLKAILSTSSNCKEIFLHALYCSGYSASLTFLPTVYVQRGLWSAFPLQMVRLCLRTTSACTSVPASIATACSCVPITCTPHTCDC